MINYSIVMRINPQDPEAPKKAYACVQTRDTMDINDFSEHIAGHGCVYSRADIVSILTMAVDCMRENLLKGNLIKLGDLGDFYPTLKSTGADSMQTFRSDVNITGVSVNWTPGDRFANMLNEASFNLVPSRKISRKLLKALKAGDTQLDFADPDNGEIETGSSEIQ